jgi:stearoyl-CoA desaturase (Delta-9 desaturase)
MTTDSATPAMREQVLSRVLAPEGIVTDPGLVFRNRRLNAVSIALPLTVFVATMLIAPAPAPTPTTWAVFIVMFLSTGVGIGVGLHRFFTHRAFQTSRIGRAVLGVFGTWAFQGPIARWVADHRRHHRYSDAPGDPHSPYWNGAIRWHSRWTGLLHSHLLWMLTGDVSDEAKYASDIRRDPVANWLSRRYWSVAVSSFFVAGAAGYVFGGAEEAVRSLGWAGGLRVSILHQITWAVNSIGHMFGDKVAGARDESRDNPALAILLLGEGLHSYHHRYPRAAVNRPSWLDPNGLLILALERCRVIWSVRRGQ